jgi:hypothetical protein
MNFLKFLSRWLVSHMIIFVLAVSPVLGANDGGVGALTGDASKTEYTKSAEATKALNNKKEHFKTRYVEDLMMGSLSLVVLGNGIPKRNDRVMSDCRENIAGPISVGLLKLGGIIYAIGISKMNNDFLKIEKEIERLTAKETAQANSAPKNEMEESKKIMELDSIYRTYEQVFEGQKAAMETKKKLYTMFEAALLTGMAFDIGVNLACNKICKNRHNNVSCDLEEIGNKATTGGSTVAKTLGESCKSVTIKSWLGEEGLGKNVQTFTTQLGSYGNGYAAPLTNAAYAALMAATKAYFVVRDGGLGAAHNVVGNGKAVAKGAKIVKDWSKAGKIWASIAKTFKGKSVPDAPVMDAAADKASEEAEEKTGSTTNETTITTQSLALKTARTTVSVAGKNLYTQMGLDVTGATAAATAMCNASCDNPAAVVGCHGICMAPKTAGILAAEAKLIAEIEAHALLAGKEIAVITAKETAYNKLKEEVAGKAAKEGSKLFDPSKILNTFAKAVKGFFKPNETAVKVATESGKKIADETPTQGLEKANEAQAKANKAKVAAKQAADETALLVSTVPEVIISELIIDKPVNCCGSEGRPSGLDVIMKTPMPKARLLTNFLLSDLKQSGQNLIDFKFVNSAHKRLKFLTRTEPIKEEKIDLNKILKLGLSSLGFPPAYAQDLAGMGSFGSLMGMGGSAIGGQLMSAVSGLANFFTKAPANRIIFYALLVGLNIHMTTQANEIIKEMDKNIAIIKTEKTKAMEFYRGGVASTNSSPEQKATTNKVGNYEETKLDGSAGELEGLCFGGDENSIAKTDCSDTSKSKIDYKLPDNKVLKTNYPEFNTNANFMASTVSKMGGSPRGLDSLDAATMANFGKISAAMRSKIAAATKELRDQHKASKSKDKMILDHMADQMQSAMNGGPLATMLNQSNTGFSSDGAVAPLSVADSVVEEETVTPMGGDSVASIAPADTSSDKKDGDMLDELGADEAVTTEAPTTAQQTLDQKLNDVEINAADISDKKDVSIFQILSNRYILSYPKVLEQEQEPEQGIPLKPEETKK